MKPIQQPKNLIYKTFKNKARNTSTRKNGYLFRYKPKNMKLHIKTNIMETTLQLNQLEKIVCDIEGEKNEQEIIFLDFFHRDLNESIHATQLAIDTPITEIHFEVNKGKPETQTHRKQYKKA